MSVNMTKLFKMLKESTVLPEPTAVVQRIAETSFQECLERFEQRFDGVKDYPMEHETIKMDVSHIVALVSAGSSCLRPFMMECPLPVKVTSKLRGLVRKEKGLLSFNGTLVNPLHVYHGLHCFKGTIRIHMKKDNPMVMENGEVAMVIAPRLPEDETQKLRAPKLESLIAKALNLAKKHDVLPQLQV